MASFLPQILDCARQQRRPKANLRALALAATDGETFEPFTFASMFQDVAGQVPVTATGQPVARLLGCANAFARGSELVTNGSFSVGTGWTVGSGWAIAAGVASHTGTSSQVLSQPITIGNGRTYEVTYTISGYTSGSMTVRFSGATTVQGTTRTANGTYTELLDNNASGNTTLSFLPGATTTLNIDNVSVKQVLGWHPSQATSSKCPTLQQDAKGYYYLSFDTVDDQLSTGLGYSIAATPAYYAAGLIKQANPAGRILMGHGTSNLANGMALNSYSNGNIEGFWRDATNGRISAFGPTNSSPIGMFVAADAYLSSGAIDMVPNANVLTSTSFTPALPVPATLNLNGSTSNGMSFYGGFFSKGASYSAAQRLSIRRQLAYQAGFDI